jgi:uncharacterized cofD-like protein
LSLDAAGPSVVALGGGHGLATTLQALRRYAGQITAVVSVADDGGSSGRLRQAVDVDLPAPGDVRRCLVALSDSTSVWSRAFEYRFSRGEMSGHALGNLLLAGLADATGDFVAALDVAAEILDAVGRVLPATTVPVVLKGRVAGREIVGQVNLGHSAGRIDTVSLDPPDARAPRAVIDAIAAADQVVIGPGSLYTSILAVCVVPDILAALRERSGGLVYVCNLRSQAGETVGLSAADHLRALAAHGVPVDVMLVDPRAVLVAAAPGALDADPAPERPRRATRTVEAPISRPDGLAHDPDGLASALFGLISD